MKQVGYQEHALGSVFGCCPLALSLLGFWKLFGEQLCVTIIIVIVVSLLSPKQWHQAAIEENMS